MVYFSVSIRYNRIGSGFPLTSKKGWLLMNLARISSNGQITLPTEIQQTLGLRAGDKVLFFQKQNGEVVLSNASARAIQKAQVAFSEAAKDMDVYSEDDIQALVDEVRYGRNT